MHIGKYLDFDRSELSYYTSSMQFVHIPWLRALLTYVLLVTTLLLYGRLHFYRDPGSMFFDESRAFERGYSAYRQHEIEEFVKGVSSTYQPKFLQAKIRPTICASFLSVKREGSQYLPVTSCSEYTLLFADNHSLRRRAVFKDYPHAKEKTSL